ncbi:MAG: TatD family hydrolase [Syntrophobacterales bacterium]|nr:TatD family hydrolase [Syntrophobacterales bacterium]
MKLVDTHAHLDFPELLQDLEGVFVRARKCFVEHIITVGIDIESSTNALKIARSFHSVSATAGVHPHGAHELSEKEIDLIRGLSSDPKLVALGEMGLDYYRDRQPRPIQRRCFEQQLEVAIEVRKPAIFHVRDAFEDFFSIVRPVASRLVGGVVHCFSGDWEVAKKCLDLGFYISIPGIVTYPKALVLQDVVKKLPIENVLLETDSPFLTPFPHRGKPNEPSYVFYTAEKVAQIRGEDLDSFCNQTSINAARIFGISLDY